MSKRATIGRLSTPVSLTLVALSVGTPAEARAQEPPPPRYEARLEVLKRILPDDPAVADGIVGLQRAVEQAARVGSVRLEGAATVPRVGVASGALAYVPVEVTAVVRPLRDRAVVGQLPRLFVESLIKSSRLTVIDTFSFEAPDDDSLRLAALVHLYYRPPGSPALDGDALVRAKVDAIVAARAGSDWPVRRLRELTRKTDYPLFLTALTLEAGEVSARGLAAWPALGRDWVGGLLPKTLDWSQAGACQHFAAAAHFVKPVGVEDLPAEPTDPGLPLLLAGDRDFRCAGPAPKGDRLPTVRLKGQGRFTLRARDLDLTDAVMIAAQAGGQATVIDGDVGGLADVELENVTFEATLAALEPLGVFASPPARIRHVSRGRRPAALQLPTGSAAPVSFFIRRGRLSDIYSLLEDVSGDRVLMPSGPLPELSVYTRETPWDLLYAALSASAGLTLRHEDGWFHVLAQGRPVGGSVAPERPRGRRSTELQWVASDQMHLAALSSDGTMWTGWLRTPYGWLLPLTKGARFFDGEVLTIDANGVNLRIDVTDPLSPERSRPLRLELAKER